MFDKLWMWITSSVERKILLFTATVVLVTFAAFVFYAIQIQRSALERVLRQKGESMAISGATATGKILEEAIATGQLTRAEVFDINHQPIPNTDPQKYNTAYDSFTDEKLLPIFDAYLRDEDVLFATAADVKGYVPTHNSRYSLALTGDYQTDLLGNRTKRIFDDPVASAIIKNTAPTLYQVYQRDTGELAWDISSPITVNGERWGAFRVALSVERINAGLTAFLWRIIIPASLVVLVISLSVYFIAYQISQPVQKLSLAAKKFGEGDLETTADVRSNDEVGQLADSFNKMASRIRSLVTNLEQRVAARTYRLKILTTLSEKFSTILDVETLVKEVVDQTKRNFDYYHVHIYLLDEKQNKLMVVAGTGEAGAEMKVQGYNIPLDAQTSLVARAARGQEVIKIDDVRQAKEWLPNPLLPDTRSEMAVPIILDDGVVGVLDIQQDKIAGFDETDANLLRSLANQVAVAIRNARQFEQVQAALAEAKALQARYVEQAWDKNNLVKHDQSQVRFSQTTTVLPEEAIAKARKTVMTNPKPAVVPFENDDKSAYVVPITLHNTSIGNLQLHGLEARTVLSEVDKTLVTAVVDQLAQAAENLRLFDETRQQAGREATIRQITEKMRASTSLEKLVAVTTEELGKHLLVSYAELELEVGDIESSQDNSTLKSNGTNG